MKTRLSHLNPEQKSRVQILLEILNNPQKKASNAILEEFGSLMSKSDTFDFLSGEPEEIECNHDIFQKVWQEASELRKSGKLLNLAKQIKCPVLAIHGDYDPHPATGVEMPLSPIIKDFRFILLPNCGHSPWKERQAGKRTIL